MDRILLTVDTGQVGAGRYKGNGFDAARQRLFDMLEEMQTNYPHLHVDIVDYSDAARSAVTQTFFSRSPIPYPAKAFDGGPFHVYFHGIKRANARYVLHMDSDMMFGGGSQSLVCRGDRAAEGQSGCALHHALFRAADGARRSRYFPPCRHARREEHP